jgi:hypothetical protein
MVSTATSRLRLNKQGTGDSVNTWGTVLNTQGLDLTDEAIAGVETIALTGNHTLTSTNYVSDEARNMGLRFTGSLSAGATITIPAVEKLYFVINDAGQTLTFTAGGTTGAIETGRRKWLACDATNVYVGEDGADLEYVDATFLALAGGTLTGQVTAVGDPTADGHLARKKYVDDSLMDLTAKAELPGQSGNSGKFLTTNGSVASWATVDLAPYLTTSTAASTYQAKLTRRNVTSASSPVTAAYGDDISCDSSGGPILINLPAAVAGQPEIIIRAGASAATNNVTVEPDGAETILGESNLQIDINYFSASFAAKAGAWV